MTESQQTAWLNTRRIDEAETIYGPANCSTPADIASFFGTNKLVIKTQNTQFNPVVADEYKPAYLKDYDENVFNGLISTAYTTATHEIRVEENQLYYTGFWTKLFGVKKIEFYSRARPSTQSDVLDEDLSRGYYHTQLIVKSRTYTSTELTTF